jgi:polysaccharide pyruvyl transferase WcaK-like protein
MKNILLVGSYGRGNIGDDAFLIATSKLLKDYNVTINASDDAPLPAEIQQDFHKIPTSGISDVSKTVKAILQSNAIVYGGGDLWVELYGDKMPRQSLWKMLFLNSTARILGKKVVYIGCGAGNLKGFSLRLARYSASLANLVLVRDRQTLEIVKPKHYKLLPDLTVTLFNRRPSSDRRLEGKIDIAVSILYNIPDPERNFETYISSIAKNLGTLDSEKFRITLLPMHTASNFAKNDIWACERLKELLNTEIEVRIITPENFFDCKDILQSADIVIASRLHAGILATWLGKPCIGIAYRPKVARFFKENKLGICHDINDLSGLYDSVLRIVNNYDKYVKESVHCWEENHDKGKDYSHMLGEVL